MPTPTPQPNEQPEPVNTFAEMLSDQIYSYRSREQEALRLAERHRGMADMAAVILREWEEKYAPTPDTD